MKKTLLLLSLFVGLVFGAQAQCTPDTTHFTGNTYVYPSADSLACIQRNQPYVAVVSIKVPSTVDAHLLVAAVPAGFATVTIDSIHIDSISGAPGGINYAINPASKTINGGSYGCILISGSTTDATGNYTLTITGKGCGHGTFPGLGRVDSCIAGDLSQFFQYSLNVCDTTVHTGITELGDNMNLQIYPNPNQGNFTLSLATADRLNGELSVVDQLGRVIYTQGIDAVGTNRIPLNLGNLASGSYMLMIKDASRKTVKQFIVK
jgi:hypothetical protein